MKFNSFEEILAWQKAKQLSISIYNDFKDVRDYDFKSQIQRASVSVMNNIAEGFERQTNKEFKNFLYISKGSCGEVRSMLSLANDLNYINKNEFDRLYEFSMEISRILSGFIKNL